MKIKVTFRMTFRITRDLEEVSKDAFGGYFEETFLGDFNGLLWRLQGGLKEDLKKECVWDFLIL